MVMSHMFHACDPLEHTTCSMSFDWLQDMAQLTHSSHLMDFTLEITMSHESLEARV